MGDDVYTESACSGPIVQQLPNLTWITFPWVAQQSRGAPEAKHRKHEVRRWP